MNKMKTFGKKDTTRRQESHDPESEVRAREASIDDRGGDRADSRFKPEEPHGEQTSRLMEEAQKSGALPFSKHVERAGADEFADHD